MIYHIFTLQNTVTCFRVFKNILFTAPLRRKESQSLLRENKENKLLTFIKKNSLTGLESVSRAGVIKTVPTLLPL